MRVAVGSGNPVKRDAVATVVDGRVAAVPVDSGVAEQPRGHAETLRGAKTRARRALAAGGFDVGVGLEGGVAEFDGADGLFLVMWGAATDGERTGVGGGPSLRLPDPVAERVRAGEELGPVMDDREGREGVGRDDGAAGVLTQGRIDRTGALAAAAAGAVGELR
jgi:inosine/xanthosine triphosphatase